MNIQSIIANASYAQVCTVSALFTKLVHIYFQSLNLRDGSCHPWTVKTNSEDSRRLTDTDTYTHRHKPSTVITPLAHAPRVNKHVLKTHVYSIVESLNNGHIRGRDLVLSWEFIHISELD